uniref:Uncharacterized protein n=1 Tax=Avena sativa TaxID=4498 RepID=A0ACD5ULV5_AVESA
MSMWMWHRFHLLLLVILALPLASNCNVVCYGHGNHNASSNHEANIRVFAAILPNKTSSTPSRSAEQLTGEFPDGMYAVSYCHNGTNSSSCRACITLALQEAQTVCPYHKDVEFSNGNCSLKLSAVVYLKTVNLLLLEDYGHKGGFSMKRNLPVSKENIMALVFQVIGFAWLFFLLQQDWHDRKRRSMM